MISLEVPVHYVVRDVKAFESLGPPAMRDPILRGAGQRELIRFLGTYSIDQILGKERAGLAEKLRERVQGAFDRLNTGADGQGGAGVEVVFVGLNGAHPPRETASSFERVVQAEQNRQSKVETARAEAIERLTRSVGSVDRARTIASELMELERLRESKAAPAQIAEKEFAIQRLLEQAGGEAAAILASASAERWTRHMAARGRAAAFTGLVESDRAAPLVFRSALYFDAMKEAMSHARVFIVSDNRPLWMKWDMQDRDLGTGVFTGETRE
jgi:regulator of protease activity HflC (stomatin/prohibitin superfamily)